MEEDYQEDLKSEEEYEDELPVNEKENKDSGKDPMCTWKSEDLDYSIYKIFNERKRLKWMKSDEVKIYISDLSQCADRADKIFINQIWEILTTCEELLGTSDKESEKGENVEEEYGDEEEDGKILSKEDLWESIEGKFIRKNYLYEHAITRAIKDTVEIIKAGTAFDDEGNEIKITAEEIPARDYFKIVDFVPCRNLDNLLTVATSSFRDMFSEPCPEVESKNKLRSRRGRANEVNADFDYMIKVYKQGETDEGYDQLTTIEQLVYEIHKGYFVIDGDYLEYKFDHIRVISRSVFYNIFQDFMKNDNVRLEEFLDITYEGELGLYGEVPLRPRMFSSQAIRNWNYQTGQTSVTTPYVPEPDEPEEESEEQDD